MWRFSRQSQEIFDKPDTSLTENQKSETASQFGISPLLHQAMLTTEGPLVLLPLRNQSGVYGNCPPR